LSQKSVSKPGVLQLAFFEIHFKFQASFLFQIWLTEKQEAVEET
jgi:hypothetical protein